jgi:hypothetical protein
MTLFDGAVLPPQSHDPNPCVRFYGAGPIGKRCKSCGLLLAFAASRRWYKCSLRKKAGPATDHRVGWNACAKYLEHTDVFGELAQKERT